MKRAGIAEDKSKGILCVDDDAGSLKLKDVTHEDRVRLQASVRGMVSKGPEGTAHLLEEIDIHVGIGPPDTTRME